MSESHQGHAHHVISDKVLRKTFRILLVFMVLTIAFARLPLDGPRMFPGFADMLIKYQSAWIVTNIIALGIAIVKTYFVIQNFMGVRFASKLVKVFAILGFVGFSMLYIMMFDYVGRAWEPVKGWERVNSTALQRDIDNEAGMPIKQYPGKEEGHE